MKKKFNTSDIYFALLLRVIMLLFLFTLTRVIFYLFNTHYFSVDAKEFLAILFYGLRFDISTIVLVNAAYIFFQTIPFSFRSNKIYQLILELFFYITNAGALFFNCIDLIFFKFTFRRTTFDILRSTFIGDDFNTLFWKYVADYWYVVLVWALLAALMIFLYRKTARKLVLHNKSLAQKALSLLWFALTVALSVVLFRGGIQLRPISLVTAGEYTTAENVPLVINTPFSIYSTSKKLDLKEKNYFDNKTALSVFNPLKNISNNKNRPFRKLNVVIIVVESLSKEYIGILNPDIEAKKYTGYTPFLDSLIGQSLCFDNMFANSKRSIEGIPSILSGLPSLMDDAYLTSSFSGNKINSLPLLLKKYGYQSMFFHGGKNGTLNFDAYTRMAGFDRYYGKNEYNNDADYDGKWGIYDEEFLKYAAGVMNKTAQPFISAIFTLSSHHPYLVPAKYHNKFKKGSLEIHESIMYADYSLKQFFNTCSHMPWFDSTLFVITADHSSIAGSSYYCNNAGSYAIPLIFYMHNSRLGGMNHNICQQADIMSSALDYLNFNEPYIAFGTSVFDTTAAHFSVNYAGNTYGLFKDSFLLQSNGDRSLALYNYIDDRNLEHNVLYTNAAKRQQLGDFLEAYIQAYNHRMVKNKLTDIHE